MKNKKTTFILLLMCNMVFIPVQAEEYARKPDSNVRFQFVTGTDFNSLVNIVNNNAAVFNDFINNGFNPLVDLFNANVDKFNSLLNVVTRIERTIATHDSDVTNLQGQINSLSKLSTDANDIAFLKAEVADLKKQVASIRRGKKK